jgi:hypothetical protein
MVQDVYGGYDIITNTKVAVIMKAETSVPS